MLPEHIAAIIGSIGVLIAAIAYAIQKASDVQKTNAETRRIEAETRAKTALIEAEREKAETETDGKVVRTISEEVVKRGDENSNLHKQLRDCEVQAEKDKAKIRELQRMNTTLGERFEVQATLLTQAALEITALKDLNDLKEATIRRYEHRYGLLPEDGAP